MKSKVDYLASKLLRSDRLYWPVARVLTRPLPAEDALEAGGQTKRTERTIDPSAPIFVTARFRSGSTFLWQLLRSFEGVTSYYEPLNERKWFLPQASNQGVDASHLGVSDYWREYDGLAALDECFNPLWTERRLYMGRGHSDAPLKFYIDDLIRRAPNRAALQFNRVDFRLGWLRENFPSAGLLHLYRNPREQWMSVMKAGSLVPTENVDRDFRRYKLFYTYLWARDLSLVFPFLNPHKAAHPYVLHYYLWRLSRVFSDRFADLSVSFEDLVEKLEPTVNRISQTFHLAEPQIEQLQSLNQGRITERWKTYADESWFERYEQECDKVLATYLQGVVSIS